MLKKKKAAAEALPAQFEKFFKGIERILPDSGFVNGRSGPTIGDIAVLDSVANSMAGLVANGHSVDPYPKVKALVEAVKAYKFDPKTFSDQKVDHNEKFDSKPVLTYFNGAGRAELARLCFYAGNVAFEDKRVSSDEFASMKANSSSIAGQRFGSLPLLQHDSLLIAQSGSISQYAADLGINSGLNALQRAVDMEISGAHADVQAAMYKALFGSEESKKQGLKDLPPVIEKFFSAFERIFPATGFLHGGSHPTLGDLAVFDLVTSPFPGVLKLGQSIDGYPKVKSLVEAIKSYPPLAQYLASRG